MNIGKMGMVVGKFPQIPIYVVKLFRRFSMETWNAFLKWFADSPIASFLRHFAAIFLSGMIAEFAKLGTFDLSNWRVWAIAGIVAAAPAFLNWLNPKDSSTF